MGSADHKHHHHHLNFHVQVHLPHIHFHHHHHQHGHHGINELMGIPKGCLPVLVGHDGEELHKFIIPVIYINHPLFTQLLMKGNELEECELHHDGPINIHCHVEEFRYVEGMIDKETHTTGHHNHHHAAWCYKA